MYRPTTQKEWLFCGPLLAQTVLIVTLQVYIMAQWQIWVRPNIVQVTVSYAVPINLAIFVFTCAYQLIMAADAMHHKNNLLLLAICVSNVCILAFSALQPDSMSAIASTLSGSRDSELQPLVNLDIDFMSRVNPALIASPIVFAICTLIIWPCGYMLHKEYAWAIYRTLHGDMRIKTRYLMYEIYLVLIKVDFFFITVFVIQYDFIDVHFVEPEFSLTIALLPASFLMMVLALWFVRREWTFAMIPIIACHAAIIAYFISRIVVLCGDGLLANTPGKSMMLLFAFVAMILMALTLICAVTCVFNFDHGLKEVLDNTPFKQNTFQFQALDNPSNRSPSPYSPRFLD